MEALTLGLLLLAAVLASSLIDQIIPRVSLPLIQIAIGLLIAVVAGGDVEVTLDPGAVPGHVHRSSALRRGEACR